MSRKIGNHFFFLALNMLKKLSSHPADFELVGYGCFLVVLLNQSHLCLSIKIFLFLFIHYGYHNRQARVKENTNTQSIFILLHCSY